jgi:tryptophan synthase
MQAGGADIIELGMPFSDPIGDGVAIQGSNTVGFIHKLDSHTSHAELVLYFKTIFSWY